MGGKTIVEKIFGKKSNQDCRAGDIVICSVDAVMGTDGSTPMAIDYFHEMNGSTVINPDRVALFADHYAPAPNQNVAELHRKMRDFAKKHNCVFFPAGEGIGNQVMMEKGFVRPGDLVLGADSHSCTFGALGAFACGIGSSDLASIWISGEIWLKVPKTIRINLHGILPTYLTAKDIALAVEKVIGADGANYQAIEFHGQALKELSMESRFVISNMVAEMGAKGGLMEVDETTYRWLAEQGVNWDESECIQADADAEYVEIIDIDVTTLSPQLSLPHEVDDVVPIEEIGDVAVDMVFIGTCTNGRIEDYRLVADMLRNNQIAQGVQLLIVPASRDVLAKMMEENLLQLFVEKGATIGTPGCGPCCGTGNGVPFDGAKVVSTANRNFVGRMGNPNAFIYLASPAVAIASAIQGKIAHPKEIIL